MLRLSSALLVALMVTALAGSAMAQDHPAMMAAPAPAGIPDPDPAVAAAPEGPGQPESGRSSLQEILRLAYSGNPTIRAARAALLVTQEDLPQAQSGWKPSADLTADLTRTDIQGAGDPDGSTSKSLGVEATQPVYRGGRTFSSIASARNVILAQRSFLTATEQDVLLQVVTAYMDVLRDQSLYDLAVNNKEVIGKQLEASRARFNVGDVTRTDVSQSEARLALAEANRVSALGDLRGARAVFEQIAGIPAATLQFPDIDLPLPDTLDEAVTIAENQNPSVLAAMFLHDAAQADIDTVFGELLPSVGLFASWDTTLDPSPGTLDDRTVRAFGIQASVPLYEAGATRSRVRAAKSITTQRRMEAHEAEALARQQAISSWEALEAVRAEILSRKAQVEASRVASEGVRQEAELGTRTILDALNAEQELLDAQSALVTAERDEVVARFTLAATLGLMTPQTLGFPELAQDYDAHLREITGKVFSTSTRFGQEGPEKVEN